MLKKAASGVLASFRSSTYPRGYASGLHSLRPFWTAFLSILPTIQVLLPYVVSRQRVIQHWAFLHAARDRAGVKKQAACHFSL